MGITRAFLLLAVRSSVVAVVDFDEANRTLHWAYAAFCDEAPLADWSCRWCCGTGDRGALVAYLSNAEAGTQGYVALDRAGARVVVSFRGSKNLANDVLDAE